MSVIHQYFSGHISVLGLSDENNKRNNNSYDIYIVPFILNDD